jgi:hypothetical protein
MLLTAAPSTNMQLAQDTALLLCEGHGQVRRYNLPYIALVHPANTRHAIAIMRSTRELHVGRRHWCTSDLDMNMTNHSH